MKFLMGTEDLVFFMCQSFLLLCVSFISECELFNVDLASYSLHSLNSKL